MIHLPTTNHHHHHKIMSLTHTMIRIESHVPFSTPCNALYTFDGRKSVKARSALPQSQITMDYYDYCLANFDEYEVLSEHSGSVGGSDDGTAERNPVYGNEPENDEEGGLDRSYLNLKGTRIMYCYGPNAINKARVPSKPRPINLDPTVIDRNTLLELAVPVPSSPTEKWTPRPRITSYGQVSPRPSYLPVAPSPLDHLYKSRGVARPTVFVSSKSDLKAIGDLLGDDASTSKKSVSTKNSLQKSASGLMSALMKPILMLSRKISAGSRVKETPHPSYDAIYASNLDLVVSKSGDDWTTAKLDLDSPRSGVTDEQPARETGTLTNILRTSVNSGRKVSAAITKSLRVSGTKVAELSKRLSGKRTGEKYIDRDDVTESSYHQLPDIDATSFNSEGCIEKSEKHESYNPCSVTKFKANVMKALQSA